MRPIRRPCPSATKNPIGPRKKKTTPMIPKRTNPSIAVARLNPGGLYGTKTISVAKSIATLKFGGLVQRKAKNRRRRSSVSRSARDDDFDAAALEGAHVVVANALVGDEGVDHVERPQAGEGRPVDLGRIRNEVDVRGHPDRDQRRFDGPRAHAPKPLRR